MRDYNTIEEIIRNYLIAEMAAGDTWTDESGDTVTEENGDGILLDRRNTTVYINVPPDPDPERIVIERTGGSISNHIRYSTIAIQSISSSMHKAAALHEHVIRWMLDATKLDTIGSVNLNSDYNYTFEAMKEYRYQAVFDIAYYAEEV